MNAAFIGGFKAKLAVKAVRVACGKDKATQLLEGWAVDNRLNEPDTQPIPALVGQDKNIGQVGKGGIVSDHPRKTVEYVADRDSSDGRK